MSKLASALPTADTVEAERIRKGPSGACDVYGPGDMEDWAAVERLRLGTTWAEAQRHVDATLNVRPIDEHKFRYHWRRKCWHWTPEQRQVQLEELA
jgi:hypothetical protein